MARTTQERMEALERKRQLMQAAVDLRKLGKTWQEVAESIGVKSRQRAEQIHKEALADGMVPTPETA